jgi:DNA-binding transcriptional LysR family regulator
MRLDQLSGYTAFLAVARNGGFSTAATALDVSPSALSQAITQLEQRLGARLFDRTTRSVRLTEAGQAFLARVGPALDELAAAGGDLADHAARPFGTLRLTVPRVATTLVLEPLLAGFLAACPDVTVEVSVDDASVDIVAAGFDVGIRLGEWVARDMITTRLGPAQDTALVASPRYLKRRGTPQSPADLARHACINHRLASGSVYRWELAMDGKPLVVDVQGPLVVNDMALALSAARADIGIAFTYRSLAERDLASGDLVRVLARHSPSFPGFYLYYSSRRLVPAKLRAFIDHFRQAE